MTTYGIGLRGVQKERRAHHCISDQCTYFLPIACFACAPNIHFHMAWFSTHQLISLSSICLLLISMPVPRLTPSRQAGKSSPRIHQRLTDASVNPRSSPLHADIPGTGGDASPTETRVETFRGLSAGRTHARCLPPRKHIPGKRFRVAAHVSRRSQLRRCWFRRRGDVDVRSAGKRIFSPHGQSYCHRCKATPRMLHRKRPPPSSVCAGVD